MSDATFDGDNLHIQIPSTGSFDAQTQIYGAWKRWIRQGDNAKYPPAFDTTGGDDVGNNQFIAPYFFCRNDLGWRLKMPNETGEIIVSGNLFPRDSNVSLFEKAAGYNAFLRLEVSTRAVVVKVPISSGTSLTAQRIFVDTAVSSPSLGEPDVDFGPVRWIGQKTKVSRTEPQRRKAKQPTVIALRARNISSQTKVSGSLFGVVYDNDDEDVIAVLIA